MISVGCNRRSLPVRPISFEDLELAACHLAGFAMAPYRSSLTFCRSTALDPCGKLRAHDQVDRRGFRVKATGDLMMRVPKKLAELLDRRRGQVQPAIAWPRDRWKRTFPAQSVFGTLPPTLDRKRVRRACVGAGASESAAKNAFLATMAWGFGNVGYGAWRVAQALKDRHAGRKLLDVVIALNSDGPQAAYRLMAGSSRLQRIGPAFGTKFLYFADSWDHARRALILDALVAEWLRGNTNFRVDPVPWAAARYNQYLDQMHDWAEALRAEPDAVELAIFQEMSQAGSNQWSRQGK